MKTKLRALLFFLPAFSFGSCVARAPKDERLLLYASAQNAYREGRFAKAASMLAKEKNFVPALVLKGKAEYLSNDSRAAEKTLKRVLRMSPQNAEASLFLARIAREGGKTEDARRLVEKLLADDPLDIRALRFAAELAGEKGTAGEAAQAALLDRAVEASAESALVFLDRSRLRWIGGNSAGALEDLARARSLVSERGPVMRAVEKLESIISEVSR